MRVIELFQKCFTRKINFDFLLTFLQICLFRYNQKDCVIEGAIRLIITQ